MLGQRFTVKVGSFLKPTTVEFLSFSSLSVKEESDELDDELEDELDELDENDLSLFMLSASGVVAAQRTGLLSKANLTLEAHDLLAKKLL